MTRERLPNRRRGTRFPLELTGGHACFVTIGFYDDGRPAEVFIDLKKSTQPLGLLFRDVAVLTSLALQHGSSFAEIEAAILKHESGQPASMVGEVIAGLRQALDDDARAA